jgi:thymidine kinase
MGSLEIVCGPMFSGKSTTILSRIATAEVLGWKYLIFTSCLDTRYSKDAKSIQTHDGRMIEATPCDDLDECFNHPLYPHADIVIIEEAQFFSHLTHLCSHLLFSEKKHILVVGLDGDAQQKKFGEILDLIPLATSVTKLTALCCECKDGTPGTYTKRLNNGDMQVDVGGAEKYAAVCLNHL